MVRRVRVALAAAILGGGLSAAPAPAAADWPRDPELERALGSRPGSIVAIDPRDGRILAYAGGLQRLREAAPPGSIAKLVTAYAALHAGKTDANRKIRCTGSYRGRTCAKAHGALTVDQALARSCNVHFLKLGGEVGVAGLLAAARDFGFGQPTGADPGEAAGRVAAPVGAADALDLAYGVGGSLTATPLQLARMIAAIVNGGAVLRLHVGQWDRREVSNLDRGPLRVLRAGLREATRGAGTAAALSALDFAVGGKTGTAVFDRPRWYGHFAGYAPADAPAVAVAVRTEGRSAAHDTVPVALRALRELVATRDVPVSRHPAPSVRVRLFASREVTVFEVHGLFDFERHGTRRRASEKGVRLAAADPGQTVLRPLPGGWISLATAEATHRGRPAEPRVRVVSGPVTVRNDRGKLIAVADLDLDRYAAGVADAELRSWSAPAAALAAQAIVARSYAFRHRDRHLREHADVCDLTHCQLYTGDRSLDVGARRALDRARGLVLEFRGEPIEALYHAACGGRTEANEAVFGGKPLPYLRGGPDPACARERMGHAVGMCQAGAMARARKGATPAEILAFYYPGAELRRLAARGAR